MNENESYYLRKLLDPDEWFRMAGGLIANAKELEKKVEVFFEATEEAMMIAKESSGKELRSIPSPNVIGVYFMLIAYGIENILKGLILSGGMEKLAAEAREKNRIPDELKGHNLRDLAEKAQVSLEGFEEELLLRLSDSAVWRGRYPAPMSERGLISKPLRDGTYASQAHFSARDIPAINALVAKLGYTA